MLNIIHSDKVLSLKFPKLITDIRQNTIKSKPSIKRIKNPIVDTTSNKVNTNSLNKFDKRHKNNLKIEDSLDIKKSKAKLIKKNRKNIIVDKDDLLIDKTDNINNEESISSLKSHKINKYKKKEKGQSDHRFGNYNLFTSSSDTNNNLSIINKDIIINSPLSIQELAFKLNMPEAEIITYLFLQGISVTINDLIDVSMAKKVALNYDFNIVDEEFKKELTYNISYKINTLNKYCKRAPIVTIFGHVDHGKTTLLDSILKINVKKQEFGGITQSINGYEVQYKYQSSLYKLVFLDTPGHEAFTSMRLRGAKITDLALLVVAADDGLRSQTIEAINYILSLKLPYIVIINKIDKNNSNILNIKEQLAKYNICSEEWGGDANIIEVSALKGQNIDILLSRICLFSDNQNLNADPEQLAEGTILEAYLDQKQGIISNVIVQNGTLKIGDFITAGNIYGKVKNLIKANNIKVKEVEPSSIVQVLGLSEIPSSGIFFQVVHTEKEAKQLINNFIYNTQHSNSQNLNLLNKRVTLDNQNSLKELKLIIKTDTQGSLEAIIYSLSKISQQKVQINIISAESGNISNNDIELALATNSLIIAFNLNISSNIFNLIKQNNLNVNTFNIIYDLLDYITNYMLSLVDTEYDYVFIGSAIVQTIFYFNKGVVAGCLVNEGKLKKMSYINICRNNNIVYKGILHSLKHIKDDVDEILLNNECGVMCEYNSWEKMDIIKAYDLIPKQKSL